jgi:hypothetical protein
MPKLTLSQLENHLFAVADILRGRMDADDSPNRSSDSFSYSTRGTSMWMLSDQRSARSGSGPEMRFW